MLNTSLVDYGIQTEESDFHIHVGYKTQHIYIFSTKQALLTITQGDYPCKSVYTYIPELHESIVTAKGYPVPIYDIPGIKEIKIPDDLYHQFPISRNVRMSTGEKGKRAVSIVKEMLKRQLINLPVGITEISEKTMQIQGTDIIITTRLKLQIKCDWLAGMKDFGGSGNVYLQVQECNPLGIH